MFDFQLFNFLKQFLNFGSKLFFALGAVGPRVFELPLQIFDFELKLINCVEVLFDFVSESSDFIVSLEYRI